MIVPWRQKKFFERFPGRNELLQYAQTHNIPVEATTKKPYSMDENLFHISYVKDGFLLLFRCSSFVVGRYESGVLEDPWVSPPADMFRMTVDPTKAPEV
jgi:argininosuccinate synthase